MATKQKITALAGIGVIVIITVLLALPFQTPMVFAHCDTMSGPVIKAAQKALESEDIKPVLIWVRKNDEAEIKKAFEKTLAVRKLNPEARELADMYFFETLVRVHRAGEGAPYTGVKPAGTEIEPAVALADKALDTGSADTLVKEITNHIAQGIKERFNGAIEKKKHLNESVEAGREYVEAYVTFVHYVEGIHLAARSKANHHESENTDEKGRHKH